MLNVSVCFSFSSLLLGRKIHLIKITRTLEDIEIMITYDESFL